MLNQRVAVFFMFLLFVLAFTVARQQTMDEMISNAAETLEMFAMPQPNADGSLTSVRVELDMVFTPEQWSKIQERQRQAQGPGRQRRKAIRDDIYRWPGGEIPYEFDNNAQFSPQHKEEIQKAIDEWQLHTCVEFVRAGNHHRNKIRFANGGGCFSNVGMVGDAQVVGLAAGCRWKSVVVHELGHAVGFQHEQTRPDRDDYVSIVESNIPPNLRYNFQKYNRDFVDIRSLPYDYRSVMHYGAKAFSINGQPTIQTKDKHFQDVIGNAQGLSFLDIRLANELYKCHERCSQNTVCPPEGFKDKNCRCMCPGDPVQVCATSGRTTESGSSTSRRTGSEGGSSSTRPTGGQCRDQYSQCQVWANRGECQHQVNKVYMQAYCQRACHFCDKEPEVKDCQDKGEHCEFWKKEGYCTTMFVDFMKTNCAQTCGNCRSSSGGSGSDAIGSRYQHLNTKGLNNDVSGSGVMTSSMICHVVIGVLAIWAVD